MNDSIPISSVLEVYANAEGVPSSQYWFLVNGKKIFDHEMTLSVLGLGHDSTVFVEKKDPLAITISLQDPGGGETNFLIKRTTRMSKVFHSYAEREGISLDRCEFHLDGEKIDDWDATPMALALDDNDVIDVKVPPMIVVLRDSSRGDMHFKVKMKTRISKLF